ncbi:UPF0102 protein [Thermodesulfomicrobium sp. WS]|jgi:putative endonuclease|uniref:YraN family protein n=1 Tax=Thermodesulfomicrobium sp. WS TaxID=3004129 RepID=UPI002492CEAD|nr:YraN family protein [Thermodesulfomicrobium sp. WS]BDV00032.1 UPF0102 protein [Thermodesulfomicrobium sp. WS]
MTSISSQEMGRLGEEAAARYLQGLGWRIRERNFRVPGGEIDLICQEADTIVFVEVKTRASTRRGTPGEAVTPAKAARLLRAASAYLSQIGGWGLPCRFDLVAVVGSPPHFSLSHDRHIVDASYAVDRLHSPWQPW